MGKNMQVLLYLAMKTLKHVERNKNKMSYMSCVLLQLISLGKQWWECSLCILPRGEKRGVAGREGKWWPKSSSKLGWVGRGGLRSFTWDMRFDHWDGVNKPVLNHPNDAKESFWKPEAAWYQE